MSIGRPEQRKQWVICADDFAFSETISRGIASLAEQGRITATSAMVLSPRWAQDARWLQSLDKPIDVGLHLDWTSPFAVGAGFGRSLPSTMLKALWGSYRKPWVREEIDRQLDAFEAVWKAPPDHIDGHQHVQQFHGILDHLLAAIGDRYPRGKRPYLRLSDAGPIENNLKSRIISAWGAQQLQRGARRKHIACSGSLAGIYDFNPRQGAYAAHMQSWAERAPDRSLLMCHPAQAIDSQDPLASARLNEFEYFRGQDFERLLSQKNIELVRGQDLYFPTQ